MRDRLEKFLLDQGLKSGKFAQIMGVQPSNITHIISGRSKPGFDFISNMLTNFPDLNPDWLILGTGEMYRQTNEIKTPELTTETKPLENQLNPTAADLPIVNHPTNNTGNISSIVVFYNDGTFSKFNQR